MDKHIVRIRKKEDVKLSLLVRLGNVNFNSNVNN